MIVQNVSEGGKTTDITFTVTKADLDARHAVLERPPGEQLGYDALQPDPNVVKVSVIGVGMRSHAGVAQRMFRALAEKGINIQVISTSEIKISVLIAEEYTELAVRALHTAYGLDAAAGRHERQPRAMGRRRGAPSLDRLWRRGREFLGCELRDHGRRHDLGVGAQSGRGDFEWRRLRRHRLAARCRPPCSRPRSRRPRALPTGRSASTSSPCIRSSRS